MVFSYSTRRFFWKGFFAVLWLVVGISYLVLDLDWRRAVICIVLGAIYLSVFVYELRYKYVEISNDEITLFSFPRQTIKTGALIDVDVKNNKVIFRASDNAIPVQRNWIHKSQQSHFGELTEQLQRSVRHKS